MPGFNHKTYYHDPARGERVNAAATSIEGYLRELMQDSPSGDWRGLNLDDLVAAATTAVVQVAKTHKRGKGALLAIAQDFNEAVHGVAPKKGN